ncbi:hypothetical protein [Terrimonas sp.]|uniref:hypothetical protein n=1 Tax=Terrimonas sp. TaxID=1914338 RepID=UPI0010574B9D|nr:hypothetical protein [Terrimonas sp.]
MLKDFVNQLTQPQATLFASIISALIAITIIFINRYFEKRKKNSEKYDAIKKYANPLILSLEQLAWRLKEILEFKGAYLLPNAPENGFFKYKFESTVYRLCATLGWIEAAKKEQSYFSGIKVRQHNDIQIAIKAFQKVLADGSHVEVSIIDELIKLYKIEIKIISDNKRALLGVKMEEIVFKYIPSNVKRNVNELSVEKQIDLIKEILDLICLETNQSQIDKTVIQEFRQTSINEISREYCWIYRDWQNAIGESMLKSIQNANRRFDIIGFAEFEELKAQNEWLSKPDALFSAIDVSKENRFDSRVSQLKQLFGATSNLIVVLKNLIDKQETISQESIDSLQKFNLTLGNTNRLKSKKRIKIKIKYE